MTTSGPYPYLERQHPRLEHLDIRDCYLCGEALAGKSTSDHIIPRALMGSVGRSLPQLPVHHACNNMKSSDDEWFARMIQTISTFSPEASKDLSKLIDKALAEKSNAYLIGKKVRNYRLAMTLFRPMKESLFLPGFGGGMVQFNMDQGNSDRFFGYAEDMCKGLFIRNVIGANPPVPYIRWEQFAHSAATGIAQQFVQPVTELLRRSSRSLFGQEWGDRVTYVGSRIDESPHLGFVMVTFYCQMAILGLFSDRTQKSTPEVG